MKNYMPAENPTYTELNFETIKEIEFCNLSSVETYRAIDYFPRDLKAERVILLPDLNPGRAPLPTGCCVEFDIEKQPEWRKFAISDVGCGMQVLKSKITLGEFVGDIKKNPENNNWSGLYGKLKDNKGRLGDLGSGNHFLDAAAASADPEELIYFIIHTGSRDESNKANDLTNMPEEFDEAYKNITRWARGNRDAISRFLEASYGTLDFILDKPHNLYKQQGDKAIIYKGAVELKPGELTLIPSSMQGGMAIVEGLEDMELINDAMSHGTGRVKSRAESKKEPFDFTDLRKRIYIPPQIPDGSISTENPSCYRKLDDCLDLVKRFVAPKKNLYPLAYLGQI